MDPSMDTRISTRFRWIFRAILIGVIVVPVLTWAVGFAVRNQIGPFARDWLYVPEYPAATQLVVRIEPTEPFNGRDMLPANKPYKVVTFTTEHSPTEVFGFYKKQLATRLFDGWRVDQAQEEPGHLKVLGFDGRDFGPMFLFEVTTEETDGWTHVTVERSWQPGL